jgi:TolB-like protein
MTDIFISYARSSEGAASRVSKTLRDQGYKAWRDDELPPHRSYGEVIEERLAMAKAVVVLWTASSAASQWVRAEADVARQAGKLVQASLEDCTLPLPFNQIHCVSLANWDGNVEDHAWRKLTESIDALLDQPRDGDDVQEERSAFRRLIRPEEPDTRRIAPRLSMIVMPFTNLSRDPEQDYFVDGVTESLTADLSRLKGSFVIGRSTAFAYKGQSIDLKQVGRDLNVRYAIEGTVQRGGDRLRVSVQLVDATAGQMLWSDRFDKPITDIFEMQDEIVTRLARELDVQLVAAEARRLVGDELDAMDLYFMGQSIVNEGFSPECAVRAKDYFTRSIDLDPNNIDALAALAQCHSLAIALAYAPDGGTFSFKKAEEFAQRAIQIDGNFALGHFALGQVYSFVDRARDALAEYQRALTLDRNLAHAHSGIAAAYMYDGQSEKTEGHIRTAFQLSPQDHQGHLWALVAGASKLLVGAAEEAETWFRRGLEINRAHPILTLYLAASLVAQGRDEEGRRYASEALASSPHFSLSLIRSIRRSSNPTYKRQLEELLANLGKAGVPEVAAI